MAPHWPEPSRWEAYGAAKLKAQPGAWGRGDRAPAEAAPDRSVDRAVGTTEEVPDRKKEAVMSDMHPQTDPTGIERHCYDLEDGWCSVHRRYCSMAVAANGSTSWPVSTEGLDGAGK